MTLTLNEAFHIIHNDAQARHIPVADLPWANFLIGIDQFPDKPKDELYSVQRVEDGYLLSPNIYLSDTGLLNTPTYFAHLVIHKLPYDPIDRWIDASCERSSGWISTADLYTSWKAYSEKYKEFTGSVTAFSIALRRRGWQKRRSTDQKRNGYICWKLKS